MNLTSLMGLSPRLIPSDSSFSPQGSISSNPRLHSLWDHLLPVLIPGMASTAASGSTSAAPGPMAATVKHLEAFWNVVVEGGLLGSESHERKFLALQLFQVLGRRRGRMAPGL